MEDFGIWIMVDIRRMIGGSLTRISMWNTMDSEILNDKMAELSECLMRGFLSDDIAGYHRALLNGDVMQRTIVK